MEITLPRIKGMKGPGMAKMGGGGRKPGAPVTPMAGKPAGGPPPMGGLGAPPRPPAPKPPGIGAGAPPPMPGGAPPMGGMGGGGGGMGGSGGFAKGGSVGHGIKDASNDTFSTSGADTKPRRKGGRDHT